MKHFELKTMMNTWASPLTGWRIRSAVLLAAGSLSLSSHAQADPAAAQRNMEQLGQQLRERTQPKPLVHVDTLGLESSQSIERLASVAVDSTVLPKAVERYWQAYMGKPVSIAQIQAFHAWFYERAARAGFMAYAKTDVVPVPGGQQLQVRVMQPRINVVRILSLDNELEPEVLQRVRARFAETFLPGMPLDTLALDQVLDSASYDQPVELEATLRAVGPELLDLVISIERSRPEPGRLSLGVVQINNHGLKQYGRAQLMGSVVLGMPHTKSQLSLVAQGSDGIAYGRAEYEALWPGAGMRWQLFGSHSRSRSVLGGTASTQGQSTELGLGLTRIVAGYRDVVVKGQWELVTRQSDSQLQATGAQISNIKDRQWRWRLSSDNERLSNDPLRAELGLVWGQYPEAVSVSVPAGTYAKVDFSLKGQQPLSANGSWRLNGRLRGQWANRNLEGYNQLTLGGVNGVRAYTSADGVGDRGVLGSLELTKTLPWNSTVSVFYDVGQVLPEVHPLATASAGRYTLQGSGVQWQGRYFQLLYTLTYAKGLRGYKAWVPSNIESEPNNQRVNVSVSYLF